MIYCQVYSCEHFQPAFTCSKLTIETVKQGSKLTFVLSDHRRGIYDIHFSFSLLSRSFCLVFFSLLTLVLLIRRRCTPDVLFCCCCTESATNLRGVYLPSGVSYLKLPDIIYCNCSRFERVFFTVRCFLPCTLSSTCQEFQRQRSV